MLVAHISMHFQARSSWVNRFEEQTMKISYA